MFWCCGEVSWVTFILLSDIAESSIPTYFIIFYNIGFYLVTDDVHKLKVRIYEKLFDFYFIRQTIENTIWCNDDAGSGTRTKGLAIEKRIVWWWLQYQNKNEMFFRCDGKKIWWNDDAFSRIKKSFRFDGYLRDKVLTIREGFKKNK